MSKIPDRTFGVELELTGLNESMAWAALRLSGVSVEPPDRGWSGSLDKWRIHDDGSIYADMSAEVVSPILRGAEGLREVRKVCTILQKAGGVVNSSCGLHVHVGARDLTVDDAMTLLNRYAKHEDFIDSMMPYDRRKSNGGYCSSVERTLNYFEVAGERFDSSIDRMRRNIADLEQAARAACFHNRKYRIGKGLCRYCQEDLRYYRDELRKNELARDRVGKYTSIEEMANGTERYVNVNLHSFSKHGTIEFRQHNGCLDGHKVANWVRFVLNFVETSRMLTAAAKASAPNKRTIDRGPLMTLPGYLRSYFEGRAAIDRSDLEPYI